MPTYRLHDREATTSASSSTHPNLEPRDVVVLRDRREALVTARVKAEPGPLAGLLEVVAEDENSGNADRGRPLG